MAAQVEFEQHRRLLVMVAGRVARRVYAAGCRTVQKEDIIQELAIAWCQARDRWQPEFNVPFGAYLMRGMSHHINRWVSKELRQFSIAPMELDATIGEDGSPHDIIPAATVPVDEMAIESDMRKRVRKMLSDRARQFVDFLEDPPPSLVEILRGYQERAQFAKARGVLAVTAPKRITSMMVMDLMGCDRVERSQIAAEIKAVSEKVIQC